ncbi:MAG: site-specific integrase [Treponema sp.]|jgi:site-specific recombinase XerD|nr:site-specific integrase [Treponema sp.]
MNVIYLFYDGNNVRIPFYGNKNDIFYQLIQSNGVWDNVYYGFIFKKDIDLKKIINLFGAVCVVYNETTGKSYNSKLKIYGFLEYSNESDKKISSSESPLLDSNRQDQKIVSHKKYKSAQKAEALIEYLSEYYIDKLEAEMRSRKFSIKTRKAYIHYNRLLCNTLQKSPKEIYPDNVTGFLAIMEKERGYSAASLNLAISAIKFFYKHIFKDDRIREQKRPDHNKILPVVLSAEEIIKIFRIEKNHKHKLLLMLAYSSGLRVSEVVSLKKEHVDLHRQVIYIKQGKGGKDRYTMLSDKAAVFIQDYYEQFNIDKWIFPGQNKTRHLTIRSAQRIFEKAVQNAGIIKNISIHSLRHTFATHLLENGTDIRYIQDLLGHSSIRTTERYTHVAKRSILKIKSPLDSI